MTKYKKLINRGRRIIGYKVGDDGSIWSKRLRSCKVTIGKEWKKLKSIRKNTGHFMVTIVIDGKQKCLYVHRLVLEAFIGPCPDGMECCHEDDNPGNNDLSNLRWDTRKSNSKDKIRNGRTNQGEKCPTSKLKSDQVLEIRKLSAEGHKAKNLAKRFKVSRPCIADIISRRRWKHI